MVHSNNEGFRDITYPAMSEDCDVIQFMSSYVVWYGLSFVATHLASCHVMCRSFRRGREGCRTQYSKEALDSLTEA